MVNRQPIIDPTIRSIGTKLDLLSWTPLHLDEGILRSVVESCSVPAVANSGLTVVPFQHT